MLVGLGPSSWRVRSERNSAAGVGVRREEKSEVSRDPLLVSLES